VRPGLFLWPGDRETVAWNARRRPQKRSDADHIGLASRSWNAQARSGLSDRHGRSVSGFRGIRKGAFASALRPRSCRLEISSAASVASRPHIVVLGRRFCSTSPARRRSMVGREAAMEQRISLYKNVLAN
jgi:hypothetical protein